MLKLKHKFESVLQEVCSIDRLILTFNLKFAFAKKRSSLTYHFEKTYGRDKPPTVITKLTYDRWQLPSLRT